MSEKKTIVSIIVTTHARPFLLSRALQSLVDQTEQNFQIILCADEGSIATKRTAEKYLRDHDVFLVLPHLKGPSQTRNEGVRYATADRLMFLDDDDTFDPAFIMNLDKALRPLFPAPFIYFNFTKHMELRRQDSFTITHTEQVSLNNKVKEQLMIGNFIPNNAFAIDANMARRFAFDHHLKSHEDWDYLISVGKELDFAYIDLYGPNVYIDQDKNSRNNDAHANGEVLFDYLSIYRKHPAKEPEVRMARQMQLTHFGLEIPAEFL